MNIPQGITSSMQVKKERKKIKKKNYNQKNIFFVPPTGFEPMDIAPLMAAHVPKCDGFLL